MDFFTRFRSLLLIICLCLTSNLVFSQDMSSVRVSDLTDKQIRNYIAQFEASGLSEDQVEQVAMARGLSAEEATKLRERIQKIKSASGNTSSTNSIQTEESSLPELKTTGQIWKEDQDALQALRPKIFGIELFQNANPQFEPDLQMATPRNYMIGSGDQLAIEIYGYSEASYNLTVSRDGNINIPNIGVVAVAGSTIEAATANIRSRLATIYSDINSGNTQVNITISNIRSIKVILTGEIVKPGTYTLPSIASVFNALYSSGGPTENGTMRNIQIIRNGRTISVLDVYDFLLDGSLSNNITLQDQDVIFVPTYEKRVELIGQVKRPAIFEMKEGETFDELLSFAGGFNEFAYQDRIKVLKNTTSGRRIEDLLSSQFSQYVPQSGDQFTISRVLERFENRVSIDGAVFRPGEYELSAGLTLSMLIKKANGVKEDAFLNVGYITRLKDNLQPQQITFNVANILAGTEPDIPLLREDMVFISSIFDLKDNYSIQIDGEIRSPGSYAYAEGRTIKDLILQAGGFRESATPVRIEVSRRMTDIDATSKVGNTAQIFQVDLNKNLEGKDANFELQPFDMVFVRTAPGYETQKVVRIEGEVLYPGSYAISNKDERITDVIKRAGGLTPFAYIDGASLKRTGTVRLRAASSRSDQVEQQLDQEDEKQQTEMLLSLQREEENLSLSRREIIERMNNDYVGVNFPKIIDKPESRENLLLKDGDLIYIPKELQTVNVGGDVLSPVTAVYVPGKSLKYYISQAGGFSEQALKKRTYVVYANGSAKSTSSFLGLRNYPGVEPGAEIYVPKKEYRERQNLSPQAWVGIGSTIASMAAIIFSIINNK